MKVAKEASLANDTKHGAVLVDLLVTFSEVVISLVNVAKVDGVPVDNGGLYVVLTGFELSSVSVIKHGAVLPDFYRIGVREVVLSLYGSQEWKGSPSCT